MTTSSNITRLTTQSPSTPSAALAENMIGTLMTSQGQVESEQKKTVAALERFMEEVRQKIKAVEGENSQLKARLITESRKRQELEVAHQAEMKAQSQLFQQLQGELRATNDKTNYLMQQGGGVQAMVQQVQSGLQALSDKFYGHRHVTAQGAGTTTPQ